MKPREVFFHVDLDAFFAAVEQLDNPAYRGKPVIVGGDPETRGVVSTCSYEARAFGVRSAMPMARAVQLCPHAVFLHGRMARYGEKSREVMSVLRDFSPDVQQISVDEAFLDMTGTERLFGPALDVARELKARVRERTGLTVSVGVAPNRYLAKISSGLSKPDGLVIVPPGTEGEFMLARALKDVWGVGEKTRARLEEAGFRTVRQIRDCPEALLATILGQAGASFLYQAVRGVDVGIFQRESSSRSLSSERTFHVDVADQDVVETLLLELAEDVQFRLLDEELSGNTVHVKIRYSDFRTVSVQETGDDPVRDSGDLYARALALFRRKYERGLPVRLIGLALCNLRDSSAPEQLGLFTDFARERTRKVEAAVHDLSKKRGKRLVTRARLLSPGTDGDS